MIVNIIINDIWHGYTIMIIMTSRIILKMLVIQIVFIFMITKIL